MFVIHGRHTVVALNDTVTGFHLGRFIVGDVALARLAGFARFVVVVIQPGLEFLHLLFQGSDVLLLALFEFSSHITRVALAMGLHHAPDGAFQLEALGIQLSLGTAPFLAGIAGQLATVNGEHVTPDETLCIADQQHVAEQGDDFAFHLANKSRDGGEVRVRVALTAP